jgi:hypothetical protein
MLPEVLPEGSNITDDYVRFLFSRPLAPWHDLLLASCPR